MTDAISGAKAPLSFWVIAGLSLLWNSFGCFDYTMTQLDPVGYMKSMQMSDESIAYMGTMPSWLTGFWALGVWGSLAGSVLLLLRSRHAVTAFVISLVGLAVSQLYQWFAGETMPAEMTKPGMIAVQALIWISLLFFIWFARRAQAQGVLR